MAKVINIGPSNNVIQMSNASPFTLIAGPCQIEGMEHAMYVADQLVQIASRLGIPFIYKSSFDKANRTSIHGARGVGLEKGLEILSAVKSKYGCPVLTDIHTEEQCAIVAPIVDVLQIPAFLCRQTDLVAAAAKTGKPINIKKGQFLAPWDMKHIVEKLEAFGCSQYMCCDRGVSFGYNTLVSDMRCLMIMADESGGAPVIFDATHSVQQPGGLGGASGGQRQFVEGLAKAAVAVGVAGIFMEVHQDPDDAPSDGPCMVKLDTLEAMLMKLMKYDEITKSYYGK